MDDDERLIATLAAALRDAGAVPRRVIDGGKTAFVWNDRYADVEFAALAYDSAVNRDPVLTRAELATLRSMVFESARDRIELEITRTEIHGQLVPPRPAQIDILGAAGLLGQTDADLDGWFVVRPIPEVPFRLLIEVEDRPVMTQLIEIDNH